MPDVDWIVDDQVYKRLQTDLRGDWKNKDHVDASEDENR